MSTKLYLLLAAAVALGAATTAQAQDDETADPVFDDQADPFAGNETDPFAANDDAAFERAAEQASGSGTDGAGSAPPATGSQDKKATPGASALVVGAGVLGAALLLRRNLG